LTPSRRSRQSLRRASAWRDLSAAGADLTGAAGPDINVLYPRRRNAAWRPCASSLLRWLTPALSPEEASSGGFTVWGLGFGVWGLISPLRRHAKGHSAVSDWVCV
jgi:hypothetical protein